MQVKCCRCCFISSELVSDDYGDASLFRVTRKSFSSFLLLFVEWREYLCARGDRSVTQ